MRSTLPQRLRALVRGAAFATLVVLAGATAAACGGDDGKKTSDTTVGDTTDSSDTIPACGGDPGANGCECRSDGSCDADLTCEAGTCVPDTVEVTGLVLPAGARGCEILLAESAGTVRDVTFATGVHGTFVREAPRVAIAVVSDADADFPAGAVQILGTATPAAALVSATCVDAAGAPLTDADVVLR